MVSRTSFEKIVQDMLGCVAIYIKMILNLVSESISVELNIKYVKPIIVTTVYKPKSKVEIYGKIDSEDKELILTGDMNCNVLNPEDKNTSNIRRIYTTYDINDKRRYQNYF